MALLEAADEKTIAEIMREAESRLQAQVTVTLASDIRAMAFMGFLATLGGAVVAGFLSISDPATRTFLKTAFVGLMAAAVLAFNASRPRGIYLVGNSPIEWFQDLKSGKSLKQSLAEQIVNYQRYLEKNRRVMRERNSSLGLASAILLLTIIVSAVNALLLWP